MAGPPCFCNALSFAQGSRKALADGDLASKTPRLAGESSPLRAATLTCTTIDKGRATCNDIHMPAPAPNGLAVPKLSRVDADCADLAGFSNAGIGNSGRFRLLRDIVLYTGIEQLANSTDAIPGPTERDRLVQWQNFLGRHVAALNGNCVLLPVEKPMSVEHLLIGPVLRKE